MKRIIVIILAAITALGMSNAYAQFTTSTSSSKYVAPKHQCVLCDSTSTGGGSFWSLYAGYSQLSIIPDKGDDTTCPGFNVGYESSVKLGRSTDARALIGFDFSYNTKSESEKSSKTTFTMMSSVVNVGLGYSIRLGECVLLTPNAGIGMGCCYKAESKYKPNKGETVTTDYTSDKTDSDMRWKSVYGVWNVGLRLDAGAFALRFNYLRNFTELGKNIDMSRWAVGIGVNI